jgi:hypothetical protein
MTVAVEQVERNQRQLAAGEDAEQGRRGHPRD